MKRGVMQAFPGNFSVFLESNSTIRKYYCRILIQLGFQGNCSPNKLIGDFYGDENPLKVADIICGQCITCVSATSLD